MEKTNFKKRIKRRIVGRKHDFFAICTPGLKRLCLREIKNLPLKLEMISMKEGGVEFTGRVHDCYYANFYLRSPSRILMRIAEFKAENFRTLEKKLNKIEWELFLKRENSIRCEVSTRHSRLYHKSAIAERTERIIKEYFAENISEEPGFYNPGTEQIKKCQKIFIRGVENHFVISLDSSGVLLHKRGRKICVGKAPLRENLGFAVLDAAGYSGKEPLIDPMCGSGTFSIEAAMKSRNIPPGFFRDFAFQDWPCFSRAGWEYLKKEAGSHFLPEPRNPHVFASDIDHEAIENLKKTVKAYNLSSSINISKRDFFDIIPEELTGEKGIVALNPPYGKRIGDSKNSSSLFLEIGAKLKKDFKGWRVGVILPQKALVSALPFSVSLTPLSHGGLKLFAATGKII